MKVSVDARPLDTEGMRDQGIGRYARGLVGPLEQVAEERGQRLLVFRERSLRRPPLPGRAQELVEQALLPLDLAWRGSAVHHSLSLYGTPLATRAHVVVTMHDVAPLRWPELYLRTGLAHRTLYRAARRAAAIVCDSSAARNDAVSLLGVEPERVAVAPLAAGEEFRPVDASGARGRLGLEGPYVLYVGALDDPRKDVQGLVDAFAAAGRPETLVLAGRGEAPRVAGSHVKLAGFVPEADLPALYSGATCFVTASRYEGFGLGALEAIACGTPVVAYDTGAIPETAGPGALLAPPGDGAALMRALARVRDEPELRERLSAEGRRHAAGFSWRRTAELTWDVYERVS